MRTGLIRDGELRLRADAARNRRSVLAAARELFARHGLETSVEEVAERAGVGVGTVYRHYPSKGQLADAVFEEILEHVAMLAGEALDDPDPWEAFARLMWQLGALGAENRGLRAVMRSRASESAALAATWSVGADRIERLLRRAQDAGSVRRDVGLADVRAALWAAAEIAGVAGTIAPTLWHRHVHLLLDGLRAPGATPMPVPAVGRVRARKL